MIPAFARLLTAVALSFTALFVSGCGKQQEPAENGPRAKTAVAGAQPVTLYVKDMTRRLKLF